MADGLGQLPDQVVTYLDAQDLAGLEQALEREGFYVVAIDGTRITDKDSLFLEVEQAFDLGAHKPRLKWAALSDQLWSNLVEGEQERVAVVWSGAEQTRDAGREDFATVVEVLRDLAAQVRDLEHDDGSTRSIDLRLFLAGTGDGFPPLRGAG